MIEREIAVRRRHCLSVFSLVSVIAGAVGCIHRAAPASAASAPQGLTSQPAQPRTQADSGKSDTTLQASKSEPTRATPAAPSNVAVPKPRQLKSSRDVEFQPLRGPVWLHTSWAVVEPWGRVPANGLVVVGETEALMVDTPWNDQQTEQVFAEVERAYGAAITKVIVTHSHDDNMAGLQAAHRLGASSYAGRLTVQLARAQGKPTPQLSFAEDLKLRAAGMIVALFYPGPGHASDNIVVCLPAWSTLFGGCLVKDGSALSLGNTADADVPQWADSAKAVAQRYPRATLVVPGHGRPGDFSLLSRTHALAKKAH